MNLKTKVFNYRGFCTLQKMYFVFSLEIPSVYVIVKMLRFQ